MGGAASLVCVDIDGDEGRASLKKLEAENSKLPKTRSQTTGRAGGGEHFLFHVDPFYVDWIRNRAKVAPGLDFRSEGGLIVAAPSLHLSGNRYQWRDPNYPIAELPEWMFKLALSKREVSHEVLSSGERPKEEDLARVGWPLERRMAAARVELAKAEPAIQGQNGSAACYRAAILVTRGFCIPVEGHNHVHDLMWEVYNPLCVPSWPEDELTHKIHDAEKVSYAPWGFRLNFAIMTEQYSKPHKTKLVAPIGTTSPTGASDVHARLAAHASLVRPQPSARPVRPPTRAELLARPDRRDPEIASQPVPKPSVDEDDEGVAECV
jgi:hypothetical protein